MDYQTERKTASVEKAVDEASQELFEIFRQDLMGLIDVEGGLSVASLDKLRLAFESLQRTAAEPDEFERLLRSFFEPALKETQIGRSTYKESLREPDQEDLRKMEKARLGIIAEAETILEKTKSSGAFQYELENRQRLREEAAQQVEQQDVQAQTDINALDLPQEERLGFIDQVVQRRKQADAALGKTESPEKQLEASINTFFENGLKPALEVLLSRLQQQHFREGRKEEDFTLGETRNNLRKQYRKYVKTVKWMESPLTFVEGLLYAVVPSLVVGGTAYKLSQSTVFSAIFAAVTIVSTAKVGFFLGSERTYFKAEDIRGKLSEELDRSEYFARKVGEIVNNLKKKKVAAPSAPAVLEDEEEIVEERPGKKMRQPRQKT